MNISNYKFKIHLKPQEDELLSSWLSRMAHAHFLYPSTFLNLYIKNSRKSSYTRRDIDFYDNKEFFDLLLNKSILSEDKFLDMSLRSQEGRLFLNKELYPPNQIRRLIDKRTHYGLLYCPKCLQEDEVTYFRKKWRYYFYTVCRKHKIFLTDRCWHCYKPIKLLKINHQDKLNLCYNCKADLSLTNTCEYKNFPDEYGLNAIQWFEDGLNNNYFQIGKEKVWSVMFFYVFYRLHYLLDKKQNLLLNNFPLLDEYKTICKRHENYNSKKASAIYKSFYLNSMVYHLFQDFPNNFLDFIKSNHLTYREFIHGLNYIPFWYKEMLGVLIPKQNKIGRIISESEVIGAIKYLKNSGKAVTQVNVAEIVGCHFSIHKGFVQIYKKLKF